MKSQTPQTESIEYDNTYKWKALTTVAMGSLMSTMDFSIINIAFPTLTKIFNTTLPTVMWTTLAYILMSTSLLMVLGKISDMLGRKKMYALGTFILCLGLASCSLAQSIGQLIFFRAIQAIGAAMCLSAGTAIVVEAFPTHERGKGLGLVSVFISLGFIIGPMLGGILLGWMNWQSIFYMRLPIGVIILIMAVIFLKEERKTKEPAPLDLWGALFSSMAIFCLVFGISRVNEYGLKSPLIYLLIGLGLLFLTILIFIESRAKDPIIDLNLFRNSVFSSASWALFLYFICQPPLFLIIPFYLIQGLQMSPSYAGLIMAVPAVFSMISGPISGELSDRVGPSQLTTFGAAMITINFFLLLLFDLHTSTISIILVFAFQGIAFGVFGPPNNSIIMGNAPRNQLGTASALIATLRQVGVSIGMAIAGTLYAARSAVHMQQLAQKGLSMEYARQSAIPQAFHDVLILSIVVGTIVTILCLYTWRMMEQG